jgi:MerR family transcriptional regulator, light-induced transcriptional regulator
MQSTWTTAEAAQALRVGTSSVKRWTDAGALHSIRTPGGHRRYTLAELHRFAQEQELPHDLPELSMERRKPARGSLLAALLRGDAGAVATLVVPPDDVLAHRASFLDETIGGAMRAIGERWEKGRIDVAAEHRATHLVTEALPALRITRVKGPLALLACPPAESHELPLHLVRLVLEWSGWRTTMLGAALPWADARAAVERETPALLAVSARSAEPFRAAEFLDFAAWCRERGTEVIVGGEWVRGPAPASGDYTRCRTLRGLVRWLGGR